MRSNLVTRDNRRFARWGVGVGLLVALGLGVGAAFGTASGKPSQVRIEVPGAMNVSVYCGGQTHFADGESIEFGPEGTDCDLEAPMSAVMPLRGRLELSSASSYRCAREAMDLICKPL